MNTYLTRRLHLTHPTMGDLYTAPMAPADAEVLYLRYRFGSLALLGAQVKMEVRCGIADGTPYYREEYQYRLEEVTCAQPLSEADIRLYTGRFPGQEGQVA